MNQGSNIQLLQIYVQEHEEWHFKNDKEAEESGTDIYLTAEDDLDHTIIALQADVILDMQGRVKAIAHQASSIPESAETIWKPAYSRTVNCNYPRP